MKIILMNKKHALALMLSAMVIAFSSYSYAAVSDARQRLNTFFTTLTSLEGSFNQQVFSKKGKVIQSSTGDISMLRPGKFRWVYKTPDPQVIVGNGKNIWIYDEDLEQVTIKPMSQGLSSAPIALLTRKQKPDAQFVVEELANTSAGLDWFKLTPRKSSNDFKYIEIGLDNNNLRKMIMHDQLGQKTVLQLNARSNVPIQGKTFYFEIPEGVDVIGKAI